MNSRIMGFGQTFKSINEFRNAVYLMSLDKRLLYKFTTNNYAYIAAICKVEIYQR